MRPTEWISLFNEKTKILIIYLLLFCFSCPVIKGCAPWRRNDQETTSYFHGSLKQYFPWEVFTLFQADWHCKVKPTLNATDLFLMVPLRFPRMMAMADWLSDKRSTLLATSGSPFNLRSPFQRISRFQVRENYLEISSNGGWLSGSCRITEHGNTFNRGVEIAWLRTPHCDLTDVSSALYITFIVHGGVCTHLFFGRRLRDRERLFCWPISPRFSAALSHALSVTLCTLDPSQIGSCLFHGV